MPDHGHLRERWTRRVYASQKLQVAIVRNNDEKKGPIHSQQWGFLNVVKIEMTFGAKARKIEGRKVNAPRTG